ncbi:hypothetical protein KUTeg_016378, partial [Tegillarca granosa]
MFFRSILLEEDESMAQGTGRLKSTRQKRITESKLPHPKPDVATGTVSHHRFRRQTDSTRSENSNLILSPEISQIDKDSPSNGSRSRSSNGAPEMGIKTIVMDNSHLVQTVEIKKRPGQTLGFYIREGNGFDRHDGVFISRIQIGTVAESNGLLHVGDEILTVNNVEVTHMSLDDVVILMSIPKKLNLKIRTKKNCNNKKNASCPSLALTEAEDKPVVVLKKGTSSSATALEETEKCPDLFEPYPSQKGVDTQYGAKRTTKYDRATSSQYASIFISPHRAEAKLLTEEGDSEHSSDGSLPRSIDSGRAVYVGHRGYVSDSAYEPTGGYFSPAALSPSQYGSASDQEYLKYIYSDGGLPRKFTPRSPSKSNVLSHQRSSSLGYDSDKGIHSEYYSGGLATQDYISHRGYDRSKKFQGGLREMFHSKSKYGRSSTRSRSPECYNSDSELIFTHPSQGQVDARGFASDYETYAGATSDDDPIYSIPKLPSSSSTELEELLRKFNTLSQELQEEQHKLQRQISTRDRTGPSASWASTSSGAKLSSPVTSRKAASTQTPIHTKIVHKPSPASITQSRKISSEKDLHDSSGGISESSRNISVMHSISRGKKVPLLSTSGPASESWSKSVDSDGRSVTRSTSRFKDLHLVKKPLQIAYSEFEFYRADMRRRIELSRTSGLDGIMGVHVLSGQGLKSSKMTLRDLYCVVSVDSVNKARTMIRTGAVNFDWDEAFDIELEDAKEISFLIYNWDPNFKHRLCFHGTLLLPGFLQGDLKKCVALKMEPKGLLYLSLLYKEPAISLQRLPSVRKNGIFGVDLETVIRQENTGLNVPIIIRKCFDEVEKRGLEVVGIYRLCGSARRKAQLREAFEKNASAVDLSPQNVSDVHVITGVLKDYLRELPEPLFTNALYQMLLDALSVRLPSDPDGSAKLMLSILECLPKANQETMAMVLNHLKKIAAKSDKNKMPISNLAVCFGPVLLCPPSSTATTLALDFKKHIDVLKYLLEIWPENYEMVKIGSDSGSKDTSVATEIDLPIYYQNKRKV